MKVCDGASVTVCRPAAQERGRRRLYLAIATKNAALHIQCTPAQWRRIVASGNAEARAITQARAK